MENKKSISKLFLICVFGYTLIAFTANINAQESEKPESVEDSSDTVLEDSKMGKGKKDKKDYASIKEFIEDGEFKELNGFMNILHETEEDKYYLIIEEDKINKEFIYFAYILNGPQDVGASGGSMGDGSILEFRKFKDDIGLYKINTKYKYDDSNKISQSKLTNIIEAFMGRFKVVVKEDNKYLISADKLFLSEMLTSVTPNIPKEYMEYYDLNIGKIDKSKTYINDVRNYPKNTAIEINYGFFNPRPKPGGSVDAVADKRYTFISARHLFVEMPDDKFEPRIADQRIGYFSEKVTDLSSYDSYPARDLMNRWRLIKKNPEAELSEPVEPIVYWVENSTPEEIRPFVVKGIEGWNAAFEKAGFKNAVVAKIQPDDAEWDAGDIQYNVVRWASTPNPQFSGYGPSIANPRTGEIIAADIVQEFNAIKRGYTYRKLWGYTEDNDPLEQWIVSLTMHEVGHTLGLRHNFKSSWIYNADDIHNVSITGKSHIGSVMDYDPINLAPAGTPQGNFFPHGPGIYDKWAIEFGYTPNMTDEERDLILAKASIPEYVFGTDGDAMGSPGSNTDPRAKRYDLSGDPVTYTSRRIEILDAKIKELPSIFLVDGNTSTEFRSNFFSLVREKGRFMEGVSRLIGGVYSNRTVNGTDLTPFEAVAYEDQKKAMSLITSKLLSNNAFIFDENILKYLQYEKRAAYSSSERGNEDPQLHEVVLGLQGRVLAHILHPRVMTRLVDSSQYGNTYLPNEVLDDLQEGIFVAKEVPTTFKMNLQSNYVDGLIKGLSDSDYDEISRSAIYNSLIKIETFTKRLYGTDELKNHLKFLNWKINKALEE
ncbi:zinc-dependent metalloprotease [Gammaproteobacteria bacterium]|nr:zinc-dependent metalloprotease [Gammaproteobacteria bacterium]MDA8808706.1 zinc-dependent metalloprotease [Gammaproteobacteria bacterium]MDA8926258.1 zinc-dependent metalloprotease [Gammaproteobacteria bacterium]MDA9001443.1 zinc-dependent metalloprotease [Gammaproteobacteria bacterium]MDA9113720.1 zinc-dependent metalloprotease [Gammaproteobacteria bacterium]